MRGLVLLLWAALPLAARAEAPLPVAAFAGLPRVSDAELSPDGKRIALVLNRDGGSYVVVEDLGSARSDALFRTTNEHAAIDWIRWANDRRLLVTVRFWGRRFEGGTLETRLFSLPIDGRGPIPLVDIRRSDDSWPPRAHDNVIDMLAGDPQHILLALRLDDGIDTAVYQGGITPGERWLLGPHHLPVGLDYGVYPAVYRIDVDTGECRLVHSDRLRFVDWMTDQQHRVRIGIRLHRGEYEVHYLDLADHRWKRAWKDSAFSRHRVQPLGFGLDPHMLYVRAPHNGRMAVFRADLRDPALPLSLVYADPQHDVSAALLRSPTSRDVIGIVDHRRVATVWDEGYRALIEGLHVALPELHVRVTSMSRDGRRYLALADNDRHPGTYYFGDRDRKTLTPFAKRYPELNPETLTEKRRIRYTARDGTRIERFLTLPDGAGDTAPPAIVFLDSEPDSRDSGSFDYWTAFFANRGYAVLQTSLRGPSGYGIEIMRATLGHWDPPAAEVAVDGTRWLIDHGIADPRRICVVGSGYGGYAALMAVARRPDLYRCAISFAGVTDLEQSVDGSGFYVRRDLVKKMFGGNFRDLHARSPIAVAAAIDAPVLLVHGTDDRYVPVEQARRMADALEAAGADFRYLEQDGGDHYLSNQAHRLGLFRAMATFLERNLAAPAPDASDA